MKMELAASADGVERLYRETREALAGYFLRRHRATHAAEDLLHETFLRLMRRADRLREARSPRAYLFGIARHLSQAAWSRNARERHVPLDTAAAEVPTQAHDPRVDDMALVSEADVMRAMRFMLLRMKLLAEPTGAVPVAALMARQVPGAVGKRVGVIVSGGNADPALVARILA